MGTLNLSSHADIVWKSKSFQEDDAIKLIVFWVTWVDLLFMEHTVKLPAFLALQTLKAEETRKMHPSERYQLQQEVPRILQHLNLRPKKLQVGLSDFCSQTLK